MSTPVDMLPARRRTHRRWVALVVVLAVATLAVLLRTFSTGPPTGSAAALPGPAGQEQAIPDPLRGELAARLVDILEKSTPAEHHQHGHEVTSPGTVVCAVDPFGMDPPNATALVQVRSVYALHLCAVAEAGRTWQYSVKFSGPLAASLADPPTLRVVPQGAGYPERVRQMIPAQYQQRATGPFLDEPALAEVRRKFDAALP